MTLRSVPLYLLLLVAIFAMGFGGCGTPRQLDPAGPYQGDVALWAADGIILDADALLGDIEALAERNPAVVAANPSLAEFVAKVRAGRTKWIAEALAARDLYARTKAVGDLSTLQGKVDALRLLLTEAQRMLLAAASAAPPAQ